MRVYRLLMTEKKTIFYPWRRLRGLGLVELGIVFFAAALLLAGALALGMQVLKAQKRNATVDIFKLVVQSTQDAIITMGGTVTNNDNLVVRIQNLAGFPDNLVDGTNVAMPYGGSLSVTGVTNNRFKVTINDAPDDICFAVGQYVLLRRNQLFSFGIGTKTYRDGSGLSLSSMSTTNLSTDCGSTSPVNMTLIYN